MAVGVAIIRSLGSYSFQGKTSAQRLLVPVVRGLDAIMSAAPAERDEDETRGNSIAPGTSSIALFALANSLVFICLLISTPVFGAYTLLLVVAALLLHFLCFLSVLLVIKEETDVWDGLLTDKDRVFNCGRNIKNPSVLVLSTLFFVLFMSVFAQQWDQTARSPFIVKLPDIGCQVGVCRNGQYLLAILYEIPLIGWLLSAILKATAPGWAAEFSAGPGWLLRGGIHALTAVYIFGVFKHVYFQRKAINDLITAFERNNDPTVLKFLVQRAQRAPVYILGKLFDSALAARNQRARQRYVMALFEARIHDFAPVFLDRLEREKSPDNQRQGLNELIKLIKTDGRRFTREVAADIFNALTKQMKIDHKIISVQEKLNEASLALVELGWQAKLLSKKRMVRLLSSVKERGNAEIRARLRELLSRMSVARA